MSEQKTQGVMRVRQKWGCKRRRERERERQREKCERVCESSCKKREKGGVKKKE